MPHKVLVGTILALAILATAATAYGFELHGPGFIVNANGGISPTALPRRAFAPIEFQGHVNVAARDGGVPTALQQAVLDFDSDGRLSTYGLPTCSVGQIEAATSEEARTVCKSSIVGTGQLSTLIAAPGQAPVPTTSQLTLFNGLPQNGDPTIILHARISGPVTQTLAVVVPIERLSGAYGYRVRLDIPPIAGGEGALTHIDLKVGRHYSVDGRRRSYISARCSRGILQTHGEFTFSNSFFFTGTFVKTCTVRK